MNEPQKADEFGSPEAAAKGGKARARALTPEQRREIAASGGRARAVKGGARPTPVATHGSPDHPLKIGNTEIPCYVLDDGRRVLAQRGMIAALGMASGAERLTGFVSREGLKSFASNELLVAIKNPITFSHPRGGGTAFGYEATILADLCEVVLRARDEKKLHHQQLHIAQQCDLLIRGFARVGIIALVDEATGYQYERARTALEELLEEFLSKELRVWVKTFPDAYFKQLCRLKNLPFRGDMKFPKYFGRMTANIVYRRLTPDLLKALEERNPADEDGRRKSKHFQWLSAEVGHPKLLHHLGAVVGLMKISPDYETFKKHLDKVAPVIEDEKNPQLRLPFPSDD